jgi:hypothetical protein
MQSADNMARGIPIYIYIYIYIYIMLQNDHQPTTECRDIVSNTICRIRRALGSYIGPEIGYSDRGLSWFPQSLKANFGIVSTLN